VIVLLGRTNVHEVNQLLELRERGGTAVAEPVAPVLHAVVRLLGICSAGMDAQDLSVVAVQAALDEFVAIAANEPHSMLSAAAVRTAELFLLAAKAPLNAAGARSADRAEPWESAASWEPAEPWGSDGPRAPWEPGASWELASATGGLRVLLAALSAAYAVDLVETCPELE
jgi:hypothetical protein